MAFQYTTTFLHLFPLLFIFPSLISSSSSSITLPLSFISPKSQPDLYQSLSHLASISLARAHHIKTPHKNVSITPLQPHSYGGYSISLTFGSPPQKMQFIMDTGSAFVWFPCTKKYLCKNCSDSVISPFIPKKSSSVKIVGCLNPKCSWIHKNPQSLCQGCQKGDKNPQNCSLQICPPYIIQYGLGSTGGIALVDTLNLPNNNKVPNFLVGCSLFSSHAPAGIAGFGRGLSSLPSQLGSKKFSYCMISHRFDDSGESSSLVLNGESISNGNLSYTPFVKNPMIPEKDALSIYYYIGLRAISVGGKKLKIPYENLVLDSSGKGGTIVDSGSTFSYLSNPIFQLLSSEIIKKVDQQYKRAEKIESLTGLKPCFNLSGHQNVVLPEIKFHFKGGADMTLPLPNYFSIVGDDQVVCLTMVTDNFGSIQTSGPSIILGNFQLQNFHVEYDLKQERFGFRQQFCK